MHKSVLIAFILFTVKVNAQTFIPGNFAAYNQRVNFANNLHPIDSISGKKWSFSRYTALSTSYTFFKGGSATIIAAPIGLQLNRRLNNNWYAFVNVAVVPAYINFNQSFLNQGVNKNYQKNGFQSNGLHIYSSASLGLQYINDAKTFSISGSISVEKSSYPTLPYYPPVITKSNATTPVYR
jgi:hypothetical protein